MPHAGRFLLDPVPGGHVLTEMLSHARKFLEGLWDLEVDEDSGDCVLVKFVAGEEEYLSPEEVLGTDVCENAATGERLLVNTATDPPTVVQSLDEMDSKHRAGTATLAVGACAASVEMAVYVFQRPRIARQQSYWSLTDLYGILGLQTFNKQPSKWMWSKDKSWERMFTSMLGGHQIVYGAHLRADTAWAAIRWPQRCLPSTCVSTAGLLILLVRFAFLPMPSGGVHNDSRRACLEVLAALLKGIESSSVSVKVVVMEHWKPPWPRPKLPPSNADVTLPLHGATGLDLGALLGLASSGGASAEARVAKKWCQTLFGKARWQQSPTNHPLLDILSSCMRESSLQSLGAQLVVGVALARNTKKAGGAALKFKWDDLGSSMTSLHRIRRTCAQHVLAGVTLTQQHNTLHMAADKGWAGGLPLSFAFLTLPDGHAILCPPTVRLVHCPQIRCRSCREISARWTAV